MPILRRIHPLTKRYSGLVAETVGASSVASFIQRRLHERLDARPVQRGQLLLELLQPSGPWQIELLIPDLERTFGR